VAAAPPYTSPAYKAGLDVDDEIRTFDGAKVNYADDILASLRRRRPGDVVSVEWTDRTGAARSARVLLEEDPRLELVTVESTGGTLTPAQRAFRSAWLGRKG
jgi:predicted metalloprotease with PDZ domain